MIRSHSMLRAINKAHLSATSDDNVLTVDFTCTLSVTVANYLIGQSHKTSSLNMNFVAWHYVLTTKKSAVKLTKISQLGLPNEIFQMLSAEQLSEKWDYRLIAKAVGLSKGLGLHQDNLFKMPFHFLKSRVSSLKPHKKLPHFLKKKKVGN